MIDSDEEYFGLDEDVPAKAQEEPHPLGVRGLALAEHYFGPLCSPIAASPAKWTAYTEHRRGANAEYRNVFDRRKRYISSAIAESETELGLADGTLKKCVSSLKRGVWYDDDSVRPDSLQRLYVAHSMPPSSFHRRPSV